MTAGRCDLCGLPLPRSPIVMQSTDDTHEFCCEGCARVYEVARDSGMLELVLNRTAVTQAALDKPAKGTQTSKETAFFDINGMWCAGCAVAAERVLRNQPGIMDVSISFAVEQGRMEYDASRIDPVKALNSINSLGYGAKITSSREQQQKERFQDRVGLQLIASIAFGMEIMVLYLVQLYPQYSLGLYSSMTIRRIQYVVWALTTPVVFYGGSTFLVGAWRSLRAKTVGMDTLVALGVLSAYLYSAYVTVTGTGQTYFDSASMIVSFILIGRYLEHVGGAQARKDLRSLLKLQPEKAWRQSPDGWEQVQAADLNTGDVILVKPGERIPADGEILDGDASLDESMLTGESLPLTRKKGEHVFAGTISLEGSFTTKVTQPPGKTRLSQIADLVTQTLSTKPRIQRLADKASTFFAFAIMILAIATFVGWFIRLNSISTALMTSVAVLVVACPCALGLATPLTMAVTMGRAAQKGILIRIPEALETASSIQRMVFDKTGTLTRGFFSVLKVDAAVDSGLTTSQLLQLAASVEQFSEHPIARAVVRANPLSLLPASDFISLRGAGTSARIGSDPGRRVLVGSTRLIPVQPGSDLANIAEQEAAKGQTLIWVAVEDKPVGIISLKDKLNSTAADALTRLRELGISTIMLSGDTSLAAQAIAAELPLDEAEGTCTPEEKARKIKEWQSEKIKVGMVGDGVNDAPALAQADLSITAAGGSDISGQASDIVLTRTDLTLVPWFLILSRQSRKTIIQNLGWAFAYNLVSVPLAMTGRISPVIAAIAMAVSSLVVVINSLRMREV